MTDAMSLSQSMQSNPGIYQTQSIGSSNDLISAPATLGEQQGQLPMGLGNATFARSGSLGTALGAGNYDISTGMLVDSAARPHLDANATDFSRMAMFRLRLDITYNRTFPTLLEPRAFQGFIMTLIMRRSKEILVTRFIDQA